MWAAPPGLVRFGGAMAGAASLRNLASERRRTRRQRPSATTISILTRRTATRRQAGRPTRVRAGQTWTIGTTPGLPIYGRASAERSAERPKGAASAHERMTAPDRLRQVNTSCTCGVTDGRDTCTTEHEEVIHGHRASFADGAAARRDASTSRRIVAKILRQNRNTQCRQGVTH